MYGVRQKTLRRPCFPWREVKFLADPAVSPGAGSELRPPAGLSHWLHAGPSLGGLESSEGPLEGECVLSWQSTLVSV